MRERGELHGPPLGVTLKRFWLSWEHVTDGPTFELHSPWWVSGETFSGERQMICAAVLAQSEEAARKLIEASYDPGGAVAEWRFCNEREPDWTPFCDRFPRAKWMHWPPR